MCSTCANMYPLIPFDKSKPPDIANDITKNNVIESFCKTCFQETSTLDFTKTYDDLQPTGDGGDNNTKVTFVIVHGGGACRSLYKPYGERLIDMGYRCILLDLPGHGTMVNTPLSLDSCVSTISKVLRECNIKPEDEQEKVIYIGCSLGAYTGFYTLSKLHDYFNGAVMIDCGQNVGPKASLKAKTGLWFLKYMTKAMSNKGLMSAMFGVIEKSKSANWKLIESTFGAGNFFTQGIQQVECLKQVNPEEYIPLYRFPIMYMNGGLDYRDCENLWLNLCQNKNLSSLKVYEHADHFFTHDSRYVEDILQRIDNFAQQIIKKK